MKHWSCSALAKNRSIRFAILFSLALFITAPVSSAERANLTTQREFINAARPVLIAPADPSRREIFVSNFAGIYTSGVRGIGAGVIVHDNPIFIGGGHVSEADGFALKDGSVWRSATRGEVYAYSTIDAIVTIETLH